VAVSSAASRLRRLNDVPVARERDLVLYWMQAFRRLHHNHALDYALRCAGELNKPLVVLEALRPDYPWASHRTHRFVLEGMRDNARAARALRLNYWPLVATPRSDARKELRELVDRACLVVTDDFPAFVIPGQSRALASSGRSAVLAVDSNGIVPLATLGTPATAAVHMRRRLHRSFQTAWAERSRAQPEVPRAATRRVDPPFQLWNPDDLDSTGAAEWLDGSVPPVDGTPGGSREARRRLSRFVERGLPGYAERRSSPAPPDEAHASSLSPYLHFGHISAEEVVEAALTRVPLLQLRPERAGRRDGFFSDDADVNAFLDETITWRDLGYHWHRHRGADTRSLETALPEWAFQTLSLHTRDQRRPLYDPDQLEAGETEDPIWNAAQRELTATGTIHNYLRMLWGKKVIEWTRTPESAYELLVHLNNKYALDGRDPNSWTGILWCFGLFDRPWGPERRVFGKVRYMSSQNTARKFKLGAYLDYVASLPEIGTVRESRVVQ
jgi:deoxyribodipyrimidine photo-lyase